MKKLKILIFAILGLYPTLIFSHSFDGKNYSLKFNEIKQMLNIRIPEEFEKISEGSGKGVSFFGFVRNGETFEDWKELITFNKESTIIPLVHKIDSIKKKKKKDEIMKFEIFKRDKIDLAYFLFKAPAKKVIKRDGVFREKVPYEGYNEIGGVLFFQNHKDYYFVSYSINYKKDLSQAEVDQLEKKIKDFLFSYTKHE